MVKVDIESTYHIILVHPNDHPLQEMQWEGIINVDPMLPFGLQSAPKITNATADARACIAGRSMLWLSLPSWHYFLGSDLFSGMPTSTHHIRPTSQEPTRP